MSASNIPQKGFLLHYYIKSNINVQLLHGITIREQHCYECEQYYCECALQGRLGGSNTVFSPQSRGGSRGMELANGEPS